MKKVRLLDSAWLMLEAPATPMHVGIVLRFSPPPAAPPDYLHRVVASLRGTIGAVSPWDLILPMQKLRGLIPIWLHDSYLDMEHHVRAYNIEDGDEDELSSRIAELHGKPLDKTRPLWECHVFAGLADGHFVLYVKVHHALLDGVGGIRLMQTMLAHSPEDRGHPAPWMSQMPDRVRRRIPSPSADISGETTREKPRVMSHLARAAGELTRAARDSEDKLATPYQAPSSRLNRRISANRSYAFETCDLARIKRIAHLSGASSNDVVLAVCAGALRKLFTSLDEPPARRLTAAVPVSIRPRHGDNTGTALCFSLADLGTEIASVRERLAVIHASTQRAKEYMGRMPKPALRPYAALTMLPFLAGHLARIGGRFRPMFNLVISNVPGPKAPLYLEGARLESVYPLSVLFQGQSLNITCIRYLDKFSFGFTACPDALPGLERVPAFVRESLAELENEFSFPHREAKSRKAARPRKVKPSVLSEQPVQPQTAQEIAGAPGQEIPVAADPAAAALTKALTS